MGTYRNAYRPYRYSQDAPTDRPFYVSKSKSVNMSDACTLIESEVDGKSTLYDIKINAMIKSIISDKEIVVVGIDDNKEYTVKFNTKNGYYNDWKEGWRVNIKGFYDDVVKNNSIIIKQSKDVSLNPNISVVGTIKSIVSDDELILMNANDKKEYTIRYVNGMNYKFDLEQEIGISGFYNKENGVIETNEYLIRDYSNDLPH